MFLGSLQGCIYIFHIIVDLVKLVDLPIQLDVNIVCHFVHFVHVFQCPLDTIHILLLKSISQFNHLCPPIFILGLIAIFVAMFEQLILTYTRIPVVFYSFLNFFESFFVFEVLIDLAS